MRIPDEKVGLATLARESPFQGGSPTGMLGGRRLGLGLAPCPLQYIHLLVGHLHNGVLIRRSQLISTLLPSDIAAKLKLSTQGLDYME